jgi:hypothetical protein
VTLISAIAAASRRRAGVCQNSPWAFAEGRSSAPPLSLNQQPNTEATPLAPTTDGPPSVGAGNSIDGGGTCARRLDLDCEAQDALADQKEEDEEEQDEEAENKEDEEETEDEKTEVACEAPDDDADDRRPKPRPWTRK